MNWRETEMDKEFANFLDQIEKIPGGIDTTIIEFSIDAPFTVEELTLTYESVKLKYRSLKALRTALPLSIAGNSSLLYEYRRVVELSINQEDKNMKTVGDLRAAIKDVPDEKPLGTSEPTKGGDGGYYIAKSVTGFLPDHPDGSFRLQVTDEDKCDSSDGCDY